MPQLTVGITYHNEGELLTRCLKSFWASEMKPSEILIYDDASSLRPEGFIPPEIPVRVIRSEVNQGPGKGRNQILKEAQGEWIHFHDADDQVTPDWCEKVSREMSNCDVVLTEIKSYQEGRVLSPTVIGLRDFKTEDEFLRFSISHFVLPAAGTFKIDLARQIGGYRESLWQSEDWDFYVRLAATKPRFKVILESLVNIEVRRESRSQKRTETLTCVLQAILFLKNELSAEYQGALAEKAAWVGSELFRLNEKESAREAFSLAEALGPARHLHQRPSYRWLAKHYGQELAEWAALFYRKLIGSSVSK
ncbi:MAG: glycosyltransferase family 2 protein [Pseudomonadota bacterium]